MKSRAAKVVVLLAVLAAAAYGGTAIASAGGGDGSSSTSQRTLDDGKDLASQATVSIDRAVTAARATAGGPIGEIDLEYVDGTLVYNVDVGAHDVKVDAASGAVVRIDSDD